MLLTQLGWKFTPLHPPGRMCTAECRGCICIEVTVSLNSEVIMSSTNTGMAFPCPQASVRGRQNKCSSSHLPGFLSLGADWPVQWYLNNSYSNQDRMSAQSPRLCWDLMARSPGDPPMAISEGKSALFGLMLSHVSSKKRFVIVQLLSWIQLFCDPTGL